MPFAEFEALPANEQGYQRAPRRLELRQADFDPTMGGHGWTEHCPKCSRARLYGWRDSVNLQHNEACRQRIEAELAMTERGKARIALSKHRIERRQAAVVAEDAQADPGKEEEQAAAVPPEEFEDVVVPDDVNHAHAPGASAPQVRRGADPPDRARVLPRTPLGEVMGSEDEEDWDVSHGQDAPMSPLYH